MQRLFYDFFVHNFRKLVECHHYTSCLSILLGFFYELLKKLIKSQQIHQNSFLYFRIAIEKLAQGNYFKHPLYTFCPEFSDEVVPFVNITPKTSLKKVMLSSLDIVPSDFLVTVTDG